MKRLALILVVVLLCDVMLTEAQIRPPVKTNNPADRRLRPGRECGDTVCKTHEYCKASFQPTCEYFVFAVTTFYSFRKL
ncbi:hypothetical protein MTO96_001797 [Rhipicephalus appendiculatus]